jgi:hypothetical protein
MTNANFASITEAWAFTMNRVVKLPDHLGNRIWVALYRFSLFGVIPVFWQNISFFASQLFGNSYCMVC